MKQLVIMAMLSCAAICRAEPLPVQEFAAGDIRVEMGRPVRLLLNVQDAAPLWTSASTLVHALAPASAFQPATSPVPVIEPSIEWIDPMVGPKTIAVTSGAAEISVPSGPERTAVYSIVWREPNGAFALRVPAAPGTFRAQIARPQPAIIVDATGSTEGVLLGDRVAVRMRIVEPGGPRSVRLFHREMPSGAGATPPVSYSSSPMECTESGPADSLWRGTIPRPEGPEVTIDYYVEIVDPQDRRSTYGTAELPHRIRIREPSGDGRQ